MLIEVTLFLNAILVLGISAMLSIMAGPARLRVRLPVIHSVIALLTIAALPFWLLIVRKPMYVDAYLPFLFNPGAMIYNFSPELRSFTPSDLSPKLNRVVIPGLFGLLTGATCWFAIGIATDKFRSAPSTP